jgi:hypothetical protein
MPDAILFSRYFIEKVCFNQAKIFFKIRKAAFCGFSQKNRAENYFIKIIFLVEVKSFALIV